MKSYSLVHTHPKLLWCIHYPTALRKWVQKHVSQRSGKNTVMVMKNSPVCLRLIYKMPLRRDIGENMVHALTICHPNMAILCWWRKAEICCKLFKVYVHFLQLSNERFLIVRIWFYFSTWFYISPSSIYKHDKNNILRVCSERFINIFSLFSVFWSIKTPKNKAKLFILLIFSRMTSVFKNWIRYFQCPSEHLN